MNCTEYNKAPMALLSEKQLCWIAAYWWTIPKDNVPSSHKSRNTLVIALSIAREPDTKARNSIMVEKLDKDISY